jgi:hypothetical protein
VQKFSNIRSSNYVNEIIMGSGKGEGGRRGVNLPPNTRIFNDRFRNRYNLKTCSVRGESESAEGKEDGKGREREGKREAKRGRESPDANQLTITKLWQSQPIGQFLGEHSAASRCG